MTVHRADHAPALQTRAVSPTRLGSRLTWHQVPHGSRVPVRSLHARQAELGQLAEDITHDTFVVAWRDLDRLRDASAVRPWLCTIARNLAHKVRRRRGREVASADPDAVTTDRTPFDVVREADVERVLASALAGIPEVYREALVLFYYERRSAKDVAAALGISEDAVHKRLSRGRKYLAAGIEPLIESSLDRARSRRDLVAFVFAALPATRGSKMWKLGALGIAAATLAVGTVSARVDMPAATANHAALTPVQVPPDRRVPAATWRGRLLAAIASEGL
jgi:RNA polymerase sigma-70 factor (ECF subfamily)